MECVMTGRWRFGANCGGDGWNRFEEAKMEAKMNGSTGFLRMKGFERDRSTKVQ